jgi:hypothetical protein
MDTLGLHIYTANNLTLTRRLSIQKHQRPGNRYEFLPCTSRHTSGVCRGLVISVVIRHAINCSTVFDFRHMVGLYWLRQQARGFPTDLLYE